MKTVKYPLRASACEVVSDQPGYYEAFVAGRRVDTELITGERRRMLWATIRRYPRYRGGYRVHLFFTEKEARANEAEAKDRGIPACSTSVKGRAPSRW